MFLQFDWLDISDQTNTILLVVVATICTDVNIHKDREIAVYVNILFNLCLLAKIASFFELGGLSQSQVVSYGC